MGQTLYCAAVFAGLTLAAVAGGCQPVKQTSAPGASPVPGVTSGPVAGASSGASGAAQQPVPLASSQPAAPGVVPGAAAPGSLIAGNPGTTATATHSAGSLLGATPLPALSIGATGTAVFKITTYGATLQANKQALAASLAAAGASAQEAGVVMAIAMQETTQMDVSQRDRSKDGTAAANTSILNMNYDFLQQLGYSTADYGASLNSPSALTTAVSYMLKAFRTWGIQRTLNFHRGGRTAFNDGVSYGATAYRNAIATIYSQLTATPALEADARRVEINVQGV